MPRKKLKKARQRRPKGQGTFFWSEARRVYVGRVEVGKKPDGSPRYVERSDPTEAGLVKKLADVKPLGPETTCAQWFDRWLADTDVRDRTKSIRRNAVTNYFDPTIGHLKLRDLTVGQINAASARWAAAVASPNTVRLFLAVLHTALRAAQAAGLRPDNPAASARRPPPRKKVILPFTVAELARVIAEASARPSTRLWALVAATGCRGGEALALDVTDYDPLTGLVSIHQTANQKREQGPTKTATGVRTIEVPEDARPALVAAIGTRTEGPLFPAATGQRQMSSVAIKNWDRMLARLKLKARNPHQCRHTIATLMLAANYAIGDVAAYLGDTPESIMRTYCHATGANVGAGVQGLLSGVKVGAAAERAAGASEIKRSA